MKAGHALRTEGLPHAGRGGAEAWGRIMEGGCWTPPPEKGGPLVTVSIVQSLSGMLLPTDPPTGDAREAYSPMHDDELPLGGKGVHGPEHLSKPVRKTVCSLIRERCRRGRYRDVPRCFLLNCQMKKGKSCEPNSVETLITDLTSSNLRDISIVVLVHGLQVEKMNGSEGGREEGGN